ncbi:hypothetical protein PUNSTDRAFT_109923 [Punctularia strigosozonata HHB-11173 SS5]|uniref:uncharacterized protein n=1 Tax=Punctularia strigosozonata (strain HHB-11173) TaxID=741275 RepID=UPI0004416A36|nr:uncharacterized protein PUNSTDRAFT_109923 [Punctularia strigosozonata HHB-11173 SS5]EIN13741.1 hypothetical protein PUNSTDRAFT_109923 [Punctularia strigosozonata HHB-11173 SS5]
MSSQPGGKTARSPLPVLGDPALRAAARTYTLALTLSLGPALVPFIARRGTVGKLLYVLKRELGPTGFAFSMTAAVSGGALLQRLLDRLAHPRDVTAGSDGGKGLNHLNLSRWIASLSSRRRAFICNMLSSLLTVILLQRGARYRRRIRKRQDIPFTPEIGDAGKDVSPTLELTLLFFVRAIDVLVQSGLRDWLAPKGSGPESKSRKRDRLFKNPEQLTAHIDAFVFWACSARIMWCFFYKPHALPKAYVKWISNLADIDDRLILALRFIRSGEWSYVRGSTPTSHPKLVEDLAFKVGCPPAWGNPALLPAYGGPKANVIWRGLDVPGRACVGGLPCEIVHGGEEMHSCAVNAGRRGLRAFFDALKIYIPVHILPVLISRPAHLLDPHSLLHRAAAIVRSASFLASFVGSIWVAVCLTRTRLLARLFPYISHDFWDGPHGCILAGCLACGGSIWIENGRRRGEMALYVLPRAIRSCLPGTWIRSRGSIANVAERLIFAASLSSLLTAAVHGPNSLRGLSRLALALLVGSPEKDAGNPRSDDSTPT